jgi:hypothetical protein
MKTKVVLKDQMHLMGELDGFEIPIDSDEKFGCQNKGSKPMKLFCRNIPK